MSKKHDDFFDELDEELIEIDIQAFRENPIPDGTPEWYSTMVDRAARAFGIPWEEVESKHINAVCHLGMKRAAKESNEEAARAMREKAAAVAKLEDRFTDIRRNLSEPE